MENHRHQMTTYSRRRTPTDWTSSNEYPTAWTALSSKNMNTEQHRPVTARIYNRINNNIQEYGHQTVRISNRTDIQQRNYTTAKTHKSTNTRQHEYPAEWKRNSRDTQQHGNSAAKAI
jgi:hypothetical protein